MIPTRPLMRRAALASMLLAIPSSALANSPAPLADTVRRHAGRESHTLTQVPTLFAPRVQKSAPALLPLLIGSGVGCGFGLYVGVASRVGVKPTAGACIGAALFGTAIGWVISAR